MKKSADYRYRQIHLDFHTSPLIPGVGADFDAEEFASMMADAHVNSVTVFAKCHHGHLYYNTDHPARHPTLKRGFDLLAAQVEALHARDIKAPIYVSIQCDEYAANTHPEWIALTPELKHVKRGNSAFTPAWQILDMSSPYQDYVADQIAEVLRKFKPVDGMFLDMCWDQPSCSRWAIDGMRKTGLDPEQEPDRRNYAHRVALGYMGRFRDMIDNAHRGKPMRIAFNARPLGNLAEETAYLRHVEIEALPTGGWGYMYFPLNARFVRPFGLPYMGMTARFHKSWADFGGIKPEAALMYECSQMLALGARCSIGDQLHPRGTLDPEVYRLIGAVYGHVEDCEPWCRDTKTVADIGVIDQAGRDRYVQPGDPAEGVVRALQPLRQQFDFIAADGRFDDYRLIIVPENIAVDGKLAGRLRAHLRRGGSVLVSGAAALDAAGKPILPELGIASHGPSPFTTTYIRFPGAPRTDHVVYERGLRLTPKPGAKALGRIAEPYFERAWDHFCSHNQTPSEKVSRYAAAVQKGRAITIAFPVFKAYATHGNLSYRRLIAECLSRLLPEPLLRADGPAHLETSVTAGGGRTVIHLVNFCPQRRALNLDIVEDVTPLTDLAVSLRHAGKVRYVRCVPQGIGLEFSQKDGRVNFVVPRVGGHEMIEVV